MRLHHSTALLAARSGWSGCGQCWSPNMTRASNFVRGELFVCGEVQAARHSLPANP